MGDKALRPTESTQRRPGRGQKGHLLMFDRPPNGHGHSPNHRIKTLLSTYRVHLLPDLAPIALIPKQAITTGHMDIIDISAAYCSAGVGDGAGRTVRLDINGHDVTRISWHSGYEVVWAVPCDWEALTGRAGT